MIEDGSDGHMLMVDRVGCKLYELFAARQSASGTWHAGSGAIWDLSSNDLRPDGWTSADAAGLPILPGLVRWDEVAAGEITHALRFTAPETRDTYIYPARARGVVLAQRVAAADGAPRPAEVERGPDRPVARRAR